MRRGGRGIRGVRYAGEPAPNTYDNPYSPRYCHLSVYLLRQRKPYDSEPWKVHAVIGALPALGYAAKLSAHVLDEEEPQLCMQAADEAPDPKTHTVAFFDETTAPGANADDYFGWEVLVNRAG